MTAGIEITIKPIAPNVTKVSATQKDRHIYVLFSYETPIAILCIPRHVSDRWNFIDFYVTDKELSNDMWEHIDTFVGYATPRRITFVGRVRPRYSYLIRRKFPPSWASIPDCYEPIAKSLKDLLIKSGGECDYELMEQAVVAAKAEVYDKALQTYAI